MVVTVAEHPGFTDRFVGGASEPARQLPPAPDARLQNRLEAQRIERQGHGVNSTPPGRKTIRKRSAERMGLFRIPRACAVPLPDLPLLYKPTGASMGEK